MSSHIRFIEFIIESGSTVQLTLNNYLPKDHLSIYWVEYDYNPLTVIMMLQNPLRIATFKIRTI